MGRRILRAAVLAMLCAGIPAAVLAHPLGNFTINHYAGILVTPADVRLDVVIDMAEIPAFQERLKIDKDGDGDVTDAETAAAAGPRCAAVAGQLRFAVDGVAAELVTASSSITFPPGLGGLSTMRIECAYVAPLASPLTRATVTFEDPSYPDRIGWREIVATGDGVSIDSGGLPTTSLSERLTTYPTDLISQPIDTRSASIVVTPAAAGTVASPAPRVGNGTTVPVGAGAVPGGIGGELPAIFRELDLTPLVALLSILTAFALGAGHALTPGHGKTIMAAYLVGTRGTSLHAVGLGLSVTVSHTLGILALAALVVGAQGFLPPDVVVRVTPVVAAVTILGIGGWMLVREVRRRLNQGRVATAGGHSHDHESGSHPHEHSHGGVTHSHAPATATAHAPAAGSTISWRGLFALGLAGGLIPSTSALIILLGSIASGRPTFGFVLVVIFGLGMAAVLSAVGLALVLARERLDRLPSGSGVGRLAQHASLIAAVVVLAFGVYLTAQAVVGRPVF
jgi:ABC-type nickel/cobalt efflux system permease component RcnA